MRQAPLHLALPAGLAIPDRAATPAWLGWALRLLGCHGIQQDGVHVAASGQLIEPLHRQQRPLAVALARIDDLKDTYWSLSDSSPISSDSTSRVMGPW
jgi:hypothetical protein